MGKNIVLEEPTYEALTKTGSKQETYNDIVRRLLDFHTTFTPIMDTLPSLKDAFVKANRRYYDIKDMNSTERAAAQSAAATELFDAVKLFLKSFEGLEE